MKRSPAASTVRSTRDFYCLRVKISQRGKVRHYAEQTCNRQCTARCLWLEETKGK